MLSKLKKIVENDSNLKELLSGSAITFIMKVFGMLLGYILILLISRKYGASGTGTYNLTISIMTFVAMISSMGLNVSVLRFAGQFNKAGEEYKLKQLFKFTVQIVLPLSILFSIALHLLGNSIALIIFKNELYQPALSFAALLIPFLTLQMVGVEFIRGLKQLRVSEFLRSINKPLINILLLIIMGLFYKSNLMPLYTLGLSIVVTSLYTIYYIFNKVKQFSTIKKNNFSRVELVSTSLPMMITVISSFVMSNVSLIMLEVFKSTEEVGVFSVAFKISSFISLALVVVNTISAPKFSELYWAGKNIELQKIIHHSSKLIFISTLPVAILLIIFSTDLLSFFGDEFISGDTTLLLLIVGQVVNSITGSVGVFLNMTGNEKAFKNIILASLLITIILNYFLIPFYGINGAAISTMIGTILLNTISVIYVQHRTGFRTYYAPSFLKK